MDEYLFLLGQNQALSRAELKAVFPEAMTSSAGVFFDKLSLRAGTEIESRICRLGGTTKVAKRVAKISDNLSEQLVEIVKNEGKKNFSLTILSEGPAKAGVTAQMVKNDLVRQGIRARFIGAAGMSLSPLIISKQHVTELIVNYFDGGIYQTSWVHPFQQWIARDRRKPYIDPRGGMLPPKLARIMVNLALGERNPNGLTLLDPFCGTGTVLMEAKLLGLKVIGGDLAAEKVAGAQRNLNWLPAEHYCGRPQEHKVLAADAVKISLVIKERVDLIVSEPFLGPPNFSPNQVPNIIKGLGKLYLGAVKDWRKLLSPGAKVVLALPKYKLGERWLSTADFIDRRENLGYNLLVKDLVFTRPGARIIRQIIILEAK